MLCGVAALAVALAWDAFPGVFGLTGAPRFEAAEASGTTTTSGQIRTFDGLDRLAAPDAYVVDPLVIEGGGVDPMAGPAPLGDVTIAPPPEVFEAAPPPTVSAPPQLRRPAFEGVQAAGGTWAVMIGINDYPGAAHDLRSAVNDANDVNEALARMGVPGDHRLLLTKGADAELIRTAVDWLVAHAGPDSTAVFFYAGHVRKLSSDREAIVASDGSIVTDADLAAQLDRLQAQRTWVMLAACYSGGFTEVVKPGRILTAASPAHSLAYENDGFKRSYLVEYMVRRAIIEGRAAGSVEAAFAWARSELSRDYPNRVPVQFDAYDGELPLRPGRTASSSPPPSSSQPAPSQPPPTQPAPSEPPPSPPPPPPGGDEEGEEWCSWVISTGISCTNS